MAKFMHQEMMRIIRIVVGAIRYVDLCYDEMFTIDNQSCDLFTIMWYKIK
jgi:hypothetical protein